ncbi:MAG: hypothetical protein L6R38_008986 [Xanthoria sp. 2 TBL-2021]|nr:MAG: hypothetical protein L6R38_008986 [Xanthoria sp. 2 TBL-2021]
MPGRRRSVRRSQRVRAMAGSPDSHPSGRRRDRMINPALLKLPPETLDIITEMLSRHEKAILAATSKAIKTYMEPQLGRKIKTRFGTSQDTAGLVGLLTERPDIVPLIKVLVLDEYHPCHARRLLSIKIPEVWCILIHHEGDSVKHVSEREKRALNRSLTKQPELTNFVFWMKNVDPIPYQLSEEDAALFRQPTVERFRLSYVDFSVFGTVDKTYFMYLNLKTLDLEDSHYSPEALNRFISPSKNLTELTIQHWGDPPFVPTRYLPILAPSSTTLKVLRLQWRHTRTSRDPDYHGLDLTAFSALRLLSIQPSVLLGSGGDGVKPYVTNTNLGITELIRSRLPPGLRMFLLESLTIPPPYGDVKMLLFPMDKGLIRCLIEQKQSLAPRLSIPSRRCRSRPTYMI